MALLGLLQVGIEAQTSQFDAGMARARRGLADFDRQTRASASTVQNAVVGLTTSAARVGGAALSIGAIVSAVKDVVQVSIGLQALRQSFTAISGSAAEGAREFQFVTKQANSLGVELVPLAERYRSLTAATRGTAVQGAQTRDLFVALTNASRAYGLSTEQVGRALVAFEQIISKGKVSQEELRGQLSEALPGASQIAARAFGVTGQAFDDLVAKGIPATEFTKRFTAQLEREAPKATDVAGSGFTRLGNQILLLKDRIGQSGIVQLLDRLANFGAGVLGKAATSAERALEAATKGLGAAEKLATPSELQAIADRQQEITRIGQVSRKVDLDRLARLRTEIAAIQRDITDRGISIAEEGPDRLGRSEGARAIQAAAEAERVQNTYQTIRNRTLDTIEAQEAATQRAKAAASAAASDAASAAEQSAQRRVALFREVEASQQRYVEGLQGEVDRLRYTREELEQRALVEQGLEAPQHARAEALLQELAIRRELASYFEEEIRASAAEAEQLERIADAYARIVERTHDRARLEDLDEERDRVRQLSQVSRQLTDSLSDLALGGSRSLAELGESFGRTIYRMIYDALRLDEALTTLLRKLIGTSGPEGTGVLGWLARLLPGAAAAVAGGAGGGAALGLTGTGSDVPAYTTGGVEAVPAFQHGGYAMPYRSYLVGERGPELLRMGGQGGHVVPQGTVKQGHSYTINMSISGPSAESFQRSSGEIQARLGQMIRNIGRNM